MKFESILGTIWLDATPHALSQISYTPIVETPLANQEILALAQTQLLEFLAGKRKTFDVPYIFEKGTDFQKEVWHALTEINFGQTCSYQTIAEKIQRPKAVRAIGQANRNNPLPIIVPCHRVIGKNGKLVGYSGSSEAGLKIKAQLLTLENPLLQTSALF
ncbi:methylated-DNA--[protein]-cysteine S-methyltransferase [Enterococcus dongliensis]|uniref:methylated-DNA--[protein]-cysteine S-methyltransferase n=1 Tax=Enterococcus dongliensis TaxID=2559925 RepID=A0AAP5ND92_9ENTE|nr:methylated-DNA--[protein]-cysteine S-methyltransferase [Enterococcus dongliensis]MDT2598014.1 methylated-DNA--[protein]-cysteine S-methyltransferase [Enterococcus dongliensis]MDT2604762.1 methylated-DNA--[protein]-cysteine S-methyltransferase [Enterococcus dongliensis]MDT2635425.1 methylated-DNA--[protein]-cysteine S-methyltransferase [Enterococcus dongliensis]MDT2637994.1 methylated-DNA--[protein]-cysteine S-methyltransferase [Enterococcus dongliensis]MDT2640624.1 methylated-DNA--[protein]